MLAESTVRILRERAFLLTLAFWLFHMMLTASRAVWLPIHPEALGLRLGLLTAAGFILCTILFLIIERLGARPLPQVIAALVAGAMAAGLVNAGVGVVAHWWSTGSWDPDARPLAFLATASHWAWVFLAWSALVIALAIHLWATAAIGRTSRLNPSLDREALWVPHRRQLLRIGLSDVVRFEAAGDYVVVHTTGRDYMTYASLSSLQLRLDPAAFVRVHRGAIVRLQAVAGIERGPTGLIRLRMDNGDLVAVGRTYRKALRRRLAR